MHQIDPDSSFRLGLDFLFIMNQLDLTLRFFTLAVHLSRASHAIRVVEALLFYNFYLAFYISHTHLYLNINHQVFNINKKNNPDILPSSISGLFLSVSIS